MFSYDDPDPSDWNKWWIWTLIMIGAILASLGLSAVFAFFFPSDVESDGALPDEQAQKEPFFIDRQASTVNPL